MFNLRHFKGGHFHLISDENKTLPSHNVKRCLARGHLTKNEKLHKFPLVMASSRLNTEPVHEISKNVVCATTKTSVQPAHLRSLIRAFANLEYSMTVKLLTEHHLELLSLKGGCLGRSASTLVKCQIVGNLRPQLTLTHTSFPLVSPLSNHSTVTLLASGFTPLITAECIRPENQDSTFSIPYHFKFWNTLTIDQDKYNV